jgi:F-type H+-transporting ATPase subunit b
MEEFVARRTKMAETKIAQAEAQAVADVRAAAPSRRQRRREDPHRSVKGKVADDLITRGIGDVKSEAELSYCGACFSTLTPI